MCGVLQNGNRAILLNLLSSAGELITSESGIWCVLVHARRVIQSFSIRRIHTLFLNRIWGSVFPQIGREEYSMTRLYNGYASM